VTVLPDAGGGEAAATTGQAARTRLRLQDARLLVRKLSTEQVCCVTTVPKASSKHAGHPELFALETLGPRTECTRWGCWDEFLRSLPTSGDAAVAGSRQSNGCGLG